MTAPASPPAVRQRRPSWLDVRLVAGVLLVLVSVLVGARVVAAADRSVRVWAVAGDLAVGTVLARDDLRPVRVRLLDNAGRYLTTDRSPVGRTLGRDLGSGELLPVGALRARPCGSELSIPVTTRHVPVSIRKGSRVDVFATPSGAGAQRTTAQVLRGVTVQAVLRPASGFLSADAEWSITVRVAEGRAAAVVRAVRTSEIDVAVADAATPAGDGCGLDPSGGPVADGGPPGSPETPGSDPDGSAGDARDAEPDADRRRRARSLHHRRDAVTLPVLTAVTDAGWESVLVAALDDAEHGVTVVRRCVDVADLLAAAAAGTARAVVLSADLRRLDRGVLAQLASARVAVVGLVVPGDEDAERRLRQLGLLHVLPADAAAPVVAEALRVAVAEMPTAGPVGAPSDPRAALPVLGAPPRELAAARGPGTVVAVWGPTGAPGRTTVAVGVADEAAGSACRRC